MGKLLPVVTLSVIVLAACGESRECRQLYDRATEWQVGLTMIGFPTPRPQEIEALLDARPPSRDRFFSECGKLSPEFLACANRTTSLAVALQCIRNWPDAKAASAEPPRSPTPPRCDGCMQGGSCLPGTVAEACGAGGAKCAACSALQECKDGSCTDACNSTTCPGCCDGRQCRPGDKSESCGHEGRKCETCGPQEVCFRGSRMTKAAKAEAERRERQEKALSAKLDECIKTVDMIRFKCFNYEAEHPDTAATRDVIAQCNAAADRIEAKCEYNYRSE